MKALLIFLLFSLSVWADEVKVEISPNKPVAGEVFQAIFRVFTIADEEPIINFNPYNVEVVGKSNQGVRTSTTWINGKMSSSREMTIVYDLAATRTGSGNLSNITVQVGPKTLRHPTVSFSILKEPEVAADVFVLADVPKKEVYLGEGIVVRYYLYSKVPVSNLDVKKYPKLNNFLKRFLQEPERSERVTVDGQLYIRTQIYGAKLFPEKIGELRVDPLQLSATVTVSRDGDPFGTFGFGREVRSKMISSESVKLMVKPLPEAGKPENFTGLVGRHDFDLQMNNSKLIVNEPLEVKLTVSGVGALENMESPEILKNPDLEEFEANGDLKIMDADQATKVFDYTFLPKANLNLPARTVTMSYFDPDTNRYVPVVLNVPEIVVAGAVNAPKKNEQPSPEKPAQKSNSFTPEIPLSLAGPVTIAQGSWKNWLNVLNVTLSLAALIIALAFVIKKDQLPSLTKTTIPSEFKKGQFKLNEFTRWLSPVISKTGKSPVSLIKDSELSQETKAYFIDLLSSNDYKDYAHTKGQLKFTYQSARFKELDQYIQSVKNEDTTQST